MKLEDQLLRPDGKYASIGIIASTDALIHASEEIHSLVGCFFGDSPSPALARCTYLYTDTVSGSPAVRQLVLEGAEDYKVKS